MSSLPRLYHWFLYFLTTHCYPHFLMNLPNHYFLKLLTYQMYLKYRSILKFHLNLMPPRYQK